MPNPFFYSHFDKLDRGIRLVVFGADCTHNITNNDDGQNGELK